MTRDQNILQNELLCFLVVALGSTPAVVVAFILITINQFFLCKIRITILLHPTEICTNLQTKSRQELSISFSICNRVNSREYAIAYVSLFGYNGYNRDPIVMNLTFVCYFVSFGRTDTCAYYIHRYYPHFTTPLRKFLSRKIADKISRQKMYNVDVCYTFFLKNFSTKKFQATSAY